MRKLVVILLSLLLVVGIVGCWKPSDSNTELSDSSIETNELLDKEISENKGINPYVISVNGVTYDFPMTYKEFVSMGWNPTNDTSTSEEMGKGVLGADCSGNPGTSFKIDDVGGLWLYFYNPYDVDTELKDCMVIGLCYNERLDDKLKQGAVEFSKDGKKVSVGESSITAVKEAFGEPTNSIIGEDTTTYMYWDGANSWVLYLYFNSDGILEYFTYNSNY